MMKRGLLLALGAFFGAQVEACSQDLIIAAYSAGHSDGDSSSLNVTRGGVNDHFDNSWMDRGFNVAVFSDSTSGYELVSTQNFDTYTDSSDAMLSFLEDLEDGYLVAIVANDATEYYEGGNIQTDLKTFMSSSFGAEYFDLLGTTSTYRDSYAIIGILGDDSPIFEEIKSSGSGPVRGSASIDCETTCAGSMSLDISSAGYLDGNTASISIAYDDDDAGYDDSWMWRGFNIVVFSASTNEVLLESNFDTYSSSSASTSMLSFLTNDVEDGQLVVIAVRDATEWYNDAASSYPHLSSSVKTYMADNFGTSYFSQLGTAATYRDNYVFVGVKGSSTPLAEEINSAGDGSVDVSLTHDCTTPAPTVSLCEAGVLFRAESAGYSDGNTASLEIYNNGHTMSYDYSWMARGLNVVNFDLDNREVVSQASFDIYSSSSESTDMLDFLEGITDGNLVIILAMDANDYWKTTHLTSDLLEYMSSEFGASTFASGIGFRDSYILASFKGGEVIDEVTTTSGEGSAELTFEQLCVPTSSPTFIPSAAPTALPVASPTPGLA